MKHSKRPDNLIQMVFGDEPAWGHIIGIPTKDYQHELVRALNWYNSVPSTSDKKGWLVSWGLDNGHDERELHAIPDEYIGTCGAIARMTDKHFPFSEFHKNYLLNKVIDLCAKFKHNVTALSNTIVTKVVRKKKVDREEYLIACGEFEAIIDELLTNDVTHDKLKVNLKELKVREVGSLIQMYNVQLEEIQLAQSGKDLDLKEAYSHMSSKKLRSLITTYKNIIRLLTNHKQKVSTPRKPRAKKEKNIDELVAKVNFQREYHDGDLHLHSIHPTRIIASMMLVVYNTKTRKLGMYFAKDDTGLSVKGTTIQGFNPDTSMSKTIRKPYEQLTPFITYGKRNTRLEFGKIAAVPKEMNGRIGGDTILIKWFK